MKRMKEDNSGFSLVELLVSIAIFSIVSIAIFEFVMVAIRHYQKETNEVEVQYEAQLTMNQLQDFLIDTKKGVSYAYSATPGSMGTTILSDAEIPGGTASVKQLIVYDTDRYYMIEWSAAAEELLYYEYIKDAYGNFVLDTNAAGVLLAEYVRQFSVDLTFFDRNNGVGLDLIFDNEREYRVTQNVKLRNQVSVNAAISDMYGS